MKRPDPRQFDLFAVSVAPPSPAAIEREQEHAIAEDENERGELADTAPISHTSDNAALRRDDWQRERAAIDAAIAANPPEVLRWGKGAGSCKDAFFEIGLLPDGKRWRVRTEFSMPNMGSSGPYGPAEYESRDEALVAALRKELRSVAHHLATSLNSSVNHGSEAQWRSLARWCIERAPSAMFGGPDLAAEFQTMEAEQQARETRRCAALRAVHDLQEQGRKIVLDAGVYGFPDLIRDPDAAESVGAVADPARHADAWPASWAVVGHAPDQLAIRVFAQRGHASNAVVTRTVEALRAGLSVPVDIAERENVGGRPYYHAAKWAWDE